MPIDAVVPIAMLNAPPRLVGDGLGPVPTGTNWTLVAIVSVCMIALAIGVHWFIRRRQRLGPRTLAMRSLARRLGLDRPSLGLLAEIAHAGGIANPGALLLSTHAFRNSATALLRANESRRPSVRALGLRLGVEVG